MTWFHDWLSRHLARHSTLGLPAYEDAVYTYQGWLESFAQFRVTFDEAEAASINMLSMDASRSKHFSVLSSLIAKAKASRKASINQSSFPVVDCGDCGGFGAKTVRWDGTQYTFAAECVCQAGAAWAENMRRSLGADRHILRIADIRAGKLFRVSRPDGVEVAKYVEM